MDAHARRRTRIGHACLALLLIITGCSDSSKKTPPEVKTKKPTVVHTNKAPKHDLKTKPAAHDNFKPVEFTSKPKLDVTLSHGKPPKDSVVDGLPKPKTTALDGATAQNLLKRMKPLAQKDGDLKDFAKREKSQPAPRKGKTIKTEFPPPEQPAPPDVATTEQDGKVLKVLRYAPEGKVPIAPKLSVTFSQPMVAVTSHTDTVKDGVPVKLSPAVQGSWRWIGTKTLLFEPKGERLPMATEYEVTIPEGTSSKTAQTLNKAVNFKFSTPPPTVKHSYPRYGTRPLNQAMFVSFDQQIDPAQVLKHINIKSGVIFGNSEVVQATQDNIDKDPQLKSLIAGAKKGTWVAFQASKPLPYNANVRVTIDKGLPSKEGKLVTTKTHAYSFRTYGPLKAIKYRCGWKQCRPSDAISIQMTNQLDPKTFKPEMVKIEPPLPNANITVSWRNVYIYGRKKGRTTYKVTVLKDIKDVHGQNLSAERTFAISVGSDYPSLRNPGGNFVTVDPSSEPALTLFSTNYSKLRVKMYTVEPKDWPEFLLFQRDYYYDAQKQKKPPGKLIANKVVKLKATPDELTETRLTLNKELGNDGLGNLVVFVDPIEVLPGNTLKPIKERPKVRVWAQATQIGLDGFVDHSDYLGWATSLKTGDPLEGVELSLNNNDQVIKTDSYGVGTIPLASYSREMHTEKPGMLIAKKGKDVAFLPEHAARYYYRAPSSTFYKRSQSDRIKWFVFDDRKMYKPAETVTLKGWIRALEWKEGGDIKLHPNLTKLKYVVYGPRSNKLTEGEAPISGMGGFSFGFDLPKTPNLGQASVRLTASGWSHTHTFNIQEFRRPEFEVKAKAPKGPFIAGERTTIDVKAKYYAGGALPMADTTWTVTTTEASFTPPNQSKFSFGTWTPWWVRNTTNKSAKSSIQPFKGKTDVTGHHHLKLEFGMIDPPKPMTVRASASVMDVNRQAWTSSTNLLVHPSMHYVGLRSEKYFVEKGQPLDIKVIVADTAGNVLEDRPVKVRAFRTKWVWKGGKYTEEAAGEQVCDTTSKKEAVTCTFKTNTGGTYKIAATTADDYGRRNYTQITRWVSGGKTPKARIVKKEKVQLIPNKDSYQPGDTAQLLVQSPFVPAEGLMTVRRHGIVTQKRFKMTESTTTLDIPIKQNHLPNVYVQVNLVGSAKRLNDKGEEDNSLPARPAFASGLINLKVPPTQRKLSVELKPERPELEPGAETSVDVTVKDANGKPVNNSEVAIIVVDESVLALSSYVMADPMALFYVNRPADVRDFHLRQFLRLDDPKKVKANAINQLRNLNGAAGEGKGYGGLGMRGSGRGGGGMAFGMSATTGAKAPSAAPRMLKRQESKKEEAAESLDDSFADQSMIISNFDNEQREGLPTSPQTKIAVRSNFNALAVFMPAIKTDANGKATVKFKMPDNLTRYRVMAVAVHDAKRYGLGESNITARLPLMVRPSAPRFLNFGDQFQLPVVLQNQTDKPMTVQVATRATNVELTKAQAYSLQVPANDRVEVQFPATTAMAGVARFQVAASAGNWSDASEFSLPVWTPATSEAFATYGVVDKGATMQPVKTPGKVWPQFGGLHVTTTSTAMQALTDAFLYLYAYPYECAEQLSSRMISVAALRDVLEAFKAPGMPDRKKVDAAMTRDIKKLLARQNYNGGFGFWRKGQTSWPFVSLHAIHAITRAKAKGYTVSDYAMRRGNRYLRSIERHIPAYYGPWTRRMIIAYSLYVRGLQGDKDRAKAKRLIAQAGKLENLPFESIGWLLGVLTGDPGSEAETKRLRKFLNNRVTETAGAAHFASKISDGAHLVLHSDRRADGVILEALIDDQPKSDLIPKIVKGLMAHRKKGRWGNTQENAMVLLALDKYFNTFEKQTPNFVAKVWLGDVFAGQHTFKGRTTERHQVDVPMSYMTKTDGAQNLIIQKTGPGRLYYRVGMTYAPKSLKLDPADHGFVVERAYEPVDNDGDVQRLPDGSWKIKAGAKVKVKLTMVAQTRRYHVALVDSLPAGFEPMNPALATTGDLPQDKAANTGRSNSYSRWWWWSRPWFEHQNMRDERVEAFASLLWGGVHSYTYYARATTPGRFIAPPAKAEEMYSPETFGRTGTDIVIVE